MTATALSATGAVAARPAEPTVWGLTPRQVHDRFWAAFGVQVVRRRDRSEIVEGAELFLLCEPDALVVFHPAQVLDTLHWLDPQLLLLRLRDARQRPYREIAVTEGDRLIRFERVYRDARARRTRVALTWDPSIAREWQMAPDAPAPWRSIRKRVAERRCAVRQAVARVYDLRDEAEVMECLRDVIRRWKRPDSTISRARAGSGETWLDVGASVDDSARVVGPVWVGAGRRLPGGSCVAGPAVLWDEPAARPDADDVRWLELEPTEQRLGPVRRVRPREIPGKRAFDIVFSLCALALAAPLVPLIALAIVLEDGRPVLFAHRRETVGGREFPCLKFRSMRRDSDAVKAELATRNQADGPQFFIQDDPRATRVGAFLRRTHLDELPQFLNVLAGHMSVVGPRPSPHAENQYCPPWREARLSVRPGITGLWQVSRTRQSGLDFQEWIRYDLDYVENASWWLDLRILAKTAIQLMGRRR